MLAALNVAASLFAWRSGMYERKQLALQLLLIWLLPLFGAAVVLLFAATQGSRNTVRSDRNHAEWENINAGHHHGPDA